MEFGHTVSLCDDTQDLSEWSESIDLNELSQQTEVVEEPLAKRPRTDIDEDLEILNQIQDESILRPAWFDCHGNQTNVGSEIKEAICTEGFLKSGEFNAVLHNEDPYPAIYTTSTIQLFDAKFLTANSLVDNVENLFLLLRFLTNFINALISDGIFTRQQVFKLKNDANMACLTDDGHSRSMEGRKKCRQFMAYMLHYTHWHVDSTVVQDGNWSNSVLAPSILRAELDELLLFIGRLSALPADYIRTKWTPAVGSVRLTAGRHLFHLQMELNWGVIQAICKLLERENQFNRLSSSHCVNTINSIEKATISLVWDLIAVAASIYDKANQADVLKVSPFVCGCVCELWIMLIHLMDHLSTKTRLQSFWSAVSSIMSEILHPKEMESDIQEEGSMESLAPPGFTVGTPVRFCWWLLTHLSPLYWFTDRGVYSHRKKGCVPGNWVQVQGLLKQSLDGNKETRGEFNRRFPLRCCLSLSRQWSANSDLLLWLWDYFHKRMNDSFHLPGQSLNSYAVLSSSALQWMEQCKSRVSSESIPNMEDESSFSLFLRVVSLHLTKLLQSGSLRAWKQIKGRFYSKFHKRRMEELNSTGLHQFISLFLTLSCVADLEDVANKMCSLLELLDFNNSHQDKKTCVWKGLFALLLIFKENNVDLSYLAEKLSQSFTTVARDYTEPSSLDKHQQRNCWQLISLYLDNAQDVFEHKNKKDLSESKLLGNGFQWLFRSCRDNELRYLLTFVQTTLTSITQRSRKETSSSAVTAMWQHVFNHVRALMSDVQCMQSVSKHLADTLATFILSALDRYPDAVEGLPDVSFPSLVQELGTQDDIPASFVCRLLCHILPCSVAVEAIQTERLESGVIHTWFRCLVQLPPSHENLTELTRAVTKLPEMETLLRNQPGFGSVESSGRSLQLFIRAIGEHFASLNTFDETIQFREKVQNYLGDVMKYTDHVLKNGGPEELLRVAYQVAGLLTRHCYKIIYSKTQPRCLLPRLVDQFALPLPNAKNPIPPLVMQCIKSSLHQFLLGLSCLDFKRDEFIRRKIKQLLTTYFRLFNQKYQAASRCGDTTTKNPFLVVLKDSLSPNPTTEASDFRQFVVEVIRESFLCLPQPPANLTSTLFFLEHLLKRTVSPTETARNTPVLLNAITGCLLACNEFTSDKEPEGIRGQACEILRMMLTACKSAPEVTSRDILLSYLRDFLFTNLLRNHSLLFKTFESLVCFDPDLLAELVPAAKQAVVQSEQKRGVGTDKVLRSAFKLFLSRLGEKGQAEINNLEEDSITTHAQ